MPFKFSDMGFLAGTKTTNLDTFSMESAPCPHCGITGTLIAAYNAKYFHILGIPFFPMGKETAVKCTNCGKDVLEYERTRPILAAIGQRQVVFRKSWPLWHLAGTITVLILFFFGACTWNFIRAVDAVKGIEANIELPSKQYDYDVSNMIINPARSSDSIAFRIKKYIDANVTDELDKSQFRYLTRVKKDRILVLLQVDDLDKVSPDARPEFIGLVENALLDSEYTAGMGAYIGVIDDFDLELISTPTYEDTDVGYSGETYLQEFYNDDLNTIFKDTLQ